MAKQILLRMEYIAILVAALASPCSVFGTDPIVRQHLRNIDEDPKTDADPSLPTLSEFENLFESPTFTPPSEFRGAEMRRWRDNTGAYEIDARLVMIYPEKVRLRKENGRTTTVAMRRLSQFDQAYVRWVAEQMIRSGTASVAGEQSENGQ